jgi:hypothetical protein
LSDGFFRGPDGRLGPVIHLDDRDPAFEALLRQEPYLAAAVKKVLQNRGDFRFQIRPVAVEPQGLGALKPLEVLRFRDNVIIAHWVLPSR